MIERIKTPLVRLLRWSEHYVKTDMVYLAGVFFWTNLTVITSSILALLLSIAYANLLPKDVYGTYQYFLSLAGLVAAVSLSGMGNAVAQAVARGYEGVLRAAFRAQMRWAIVPSLASLAGAVYYLIHGNVDLGIGLCIIAVCIPFTQPFGTYGGLLEGKRDFRRIFYFSFIIGTAPYLCLLAIVWWVKIPAALLFVNLGVTALASIYAYRRTLALYKPNDRVDPKSVTYGRHLSVLSAWGSIISQLDSVLVFHFLGPSPLAVYSFATQIPERLGGMFGFIGNASLPNLARQPLSYIQQNIGSKILRVALGGGAVALVYVVGAPILFTHLFPKYLDSIGYTQLYTPIILLLAMMAVTNAAFYAKRLTREIYVMSFVQPLLLITLQVPLLLRWGIEGMIVARLITDTVVILLAILLLFRARDTEEPAEINRV